MENNGQFLKSLGRKVKLARVSKGMTLAKLSELTGMHGASIGIIENGKVNVHILNLKAIADILEVDVKDFL